MKKINEFLGFYIQAFKDIVKNSSIFTTLIVSVLIYSFFYPTAYKAERAEFLPIVIVDEEQSVVTNQIIDAVSKSPNVEIREITGNFADAEYMVKSHQADGILLLPNNLSNSIRRGETGGIGLYLSATNFLAIQKIGLGLASSLENALAVQIEKFGQASAFSPAISVHQIPLFNTLSGYGSYIFPAVASLIIHQTILLGVCMLIAGYREKQWRPSTTQFWAIASVIFTIGVLGCFYLFGFTLWLYEYPHGGNFWGLMIGVPIYISAVIGLAMFLASFLDMPERAGHVFVFTSVPLFLMSGIAWPHAAMPEWIQLLGNALPSTQGIQMFIKLNQMGVPTSIVMPHLIYLGSFSAICFVLAYYRLKYK